MDSDSSSISEDSVDKIINNKFKYEDNEESDDDEGEESLFNVGSDDEDEEESDEQGEEEVEMDNKYAIALKKKEMGSDLEDDEDEDGEDFSEKHLPDSKSWGSKKANYYNTDYVDKGKRQQQYLEEDDEMAQMEEEEARNIQKRLLQEMKGSDLGIEWLASESSDEEEEKQESIQADLSSMTEAEKMQMVKKMSPELIPLISDMKKYSEEGMKLEPLVSFAMKDLRGDKLRKSSGFKLIKVKYDLMEKYLQNILIYLNLRSSESIESIKKHPILGHLIKFKKLIEQIEIIIDGKSALKQQLQFILNQLATGQEIEYEDGLEEEDNESSEDEDVDIDADLESDSERRGITYEMSKNKGLTASKKKSARNPRVKHRMKFKKAIVKRKSVVKEPRKELIKYGGELSGIKSSQVRSIKFKH